MQSCLGIYIDDLTIKYSKISKEKDNIKIESSGVKFYESLSSSLNQIIQETNSQKSPIAININGETYDYIDVFSLLSKNDIRKSIDIEFEMLCNEKGYEKNLYENRYILSVNRNNPDKMRALNVSVMKTALTERTKPFEKLKLASSTPISTSIVNLLDLDSKPNVLVVNIEDTTTVTTVMGGIIDDVTKINDGMSQILSEININENSLSKSYEICKNTTISTQDTGVPDGDEYLDVIMPTLYKIVNEVKRIQESIPEPIETIYLTGSARMQDKFADSQGTFGSRTEVFTSGLSGFKKEPLLGLGFAVSYNSKGEIIVGRMESGSGWLSILSQTGLIGFILVCSLLLKTLKVLPYLLIDNKLLLYFCAFLYLCFHSLFEGYLLTIGYYPCILFWTLLGFLHVYPYYKCVENKFNAWQTVNKLPVI